MKIEFIWGTDIHLDILDDQDDAVEKWIEEKIKPLSSETILLTGDISTGPKVIEHLRKIRSLSEKRILFVFGNHDFWEDSISNIRTKAASEELKNEGITWMGSVNFVPFGKSTALVGHDGWYDAMFGNYVSSRFVMKDWFRILEFKNAFHDLIPACRKLASEAARHVQSSCIKAIADGRKKIVVMTHFPPFEEACFYRGRRSDADALPWYSSKLMGQVLLSLAESNSDVSFTILCGHTHSFADIHVLPNLRVIVGNSDYGYPNVNVIGVEE